MILRNQKIVDKLNQMIEDSNSTSSYKINPIKVNEEFNIEDLYKINKMDCYASFSYDEYITAQEEESFIEDMQILQERELDEWRFDEISIGICIKNITELSSEDAKRLKGRPKIFLYDEETCTQSSNSYMYVDEYCLARQEADKFMEDIDMNTSQNEIFMQIFQKLRQQYQYGMPIEKGYKTGVRASQNIFGTLILKKAVCRGISETLRNLSLMAKIPAKSIPCSVTVDNDKVGHCYNQVQLELEGEKKWGNVDLTMDQKKENLENFFKSDEDFQQTHNQLKNLCSYKEVCDKSMPDEQVNELEDKYKESIPSRSTKEELSAYVVSAVEDGTVKLEELENLDKTFQNEMFQEKASEEINR